MPKKPEEWLEVASPTNKTRGIFKLFLGYAPGVGKTYSMLSEAIRQRSNSKDFDFIAAHRGMFSLLGLENSVVEHLKANNGVYMIGDSRINVAGIPEDRIGDLADAMLAAIK